jgi:hypothetical protein
MEDQKVLIVQALLLEVDFANAVVGGRWS